MHHVVPKSDVLHRSVRLADRAAGADGGRLRMRPGLWNVPLALAIAIVKAVLIVLFFMHVRYGSPLVRLFAAGGFFWLLIMLAFVLTDVKMRCGAGEYLPARVSRRAVSRRPSKHHPPALGRRRSRSPRHTNLESFHRRFAMTAAGLRHASDRGRNFRRPGSSIQTGHRSPAAPNLPAQAQTRSPARTRFRETVRGASRRHRTRSICRRLRYSETGPVSSRNHLDPMRLRIEKHAGKRHEAALRHIIHQEAIEPVDDRGKVLLVRRHTGSAYARQTAATMPGRCRGRRRRPARSKCGRPAAAANRNSRRRFCPPLDSNRQCRSRANPVWRLAVALAESAARYPDRARFAGVPLFPRQAGRRAIASPPSCD